ncbi:MAG: PAS domain S-box protein [Desulfobacterales bacterium]|jgi:PAS domain S-box-containing protein|nr:PAS domain S-box protein [Desulfobacterales bacterium]
MEQVETLNVAIVGGGIGFKAIIDMILAEKLSQLRMKVIGVADIDSRAVGYCYAQEKGIYTTTDYHDLYRLKDLNMIIELTGRLEVVNEISRTKPDHVRLMDHVGARLFWDIFQIEEKRIAERREAEEKLRESELFLCSVFDSIQDGISVLDCDLNIIRVNSWIEKMYAPHMPLVGKKCYVTYQQRETPCPLCPSIKTLSTGGTHRSSVPYPSEKKQVGWIDLSSFPLRDADNRVIGVIEHAKDITDRKLAEEKLRKSEERFDAMLRSIGDHMSMMDKDLNIIWANEIAKKIFGNNIIGKKCYEIYHKRKKPCEPYPCLTLKSFQDGKIHEHDTQVIDKDGKIVYFHCTANVALRDENGKPVAVIEISRDITDHKLAEERLRASESRYRELVENANSIILRRDTEGNITFFNEFAQHFFGYTEDEILGKNVVGTIVPETDSAGRDLTSMIRDIGLHPERYAANENENMRRNGEPVWIVWTNKAIRDEDGKIVEILCVGNDITERKWLEKQLRYAQKMESIGTLAGGVAHDFNNLLMAILGNTALMLLNTDPASPDYNKLKNIEKQVESGATLTAQLLGYARKGRYEVRPISLNRLVEETSDAFGRTRKEITIHRELAEDLFAIEADEGQIEQLLLNLFMNAADAMSTRADGAAGRPGGGDLILKTINATHNDIKSKLYYVKQGNYILLTVTDTGIGMDKETAERIFEPFFTTKEMGRGTGLGLASVYGIIKGHSGYIEVESRKGRGTTFSVYLPASERKFQKAAGSTGEFIKETGTVLLVDDEDAVLEVGQEVLKALGYRVLTAGDGKEAVEVYRKNRDKIDIVLLDMVMPNMGGGEAYDRMKEIDPDIKVLLLSGFSVDGKARKILERGCNGFIQKPFSMEELSGKISKILFDNK